jgi:anti-sigma regulatory factor (Ser/Thr protein kinase)
VRFAADAASVPGARRFVVDGLTSWGRTDLVDQAELVASELTGNAALHADAHFMYLTLVADDGPTVRIGVEDDGPVGVEAVQPLTLAATEGYLDWSDQAATGRGLAIVAMLAKEWGVESTARGKRVWADLVDPDAVHEVRDPTRVAAPPGAGRASDLPPDWALVRLADCPVELSLQQDRHLDELIRELQLMAANHGNPQSLEVADQLRDLLATPAPARVTGRRAAERARAEGRENVDVEMAMPRAFSALIPQLRDAVRRADELCEEGHLLALASPPEIRTLRSWMAHEIIAQAARGRDPIPWTEWDDRVWPDDL